LLNVVISSIILAITFSIVGNVSTVNGEWKIPTEIKTKQFTTSENDLLKIDYPVNWNITEEKDSIIFHPNKDSSDQLKITAISFPSSLITLKSIVDLTLDQFAKNLTEFNLLESNNFPNIKSDNHKLVYSYLDNNNSKIKQADIGIVQGDKLFVLSLISSPNNYYSYLPDFETVLTSFNYYNEQRMLNQYSSQLVSPVANFVPILGNSSSNVTIVEFGDYQCTFCAQFHNETRNQVLSNFVDTGKTKFLFKDFIVNDSTNDTSSTFAAEASYCAAEQGKYWDYHSEIYDNWAGERTGWITPESLKKFAINVKVPNIEQFSECLDSHKYTNLVQLNDNIARNLGLTGTPSFVLLKNNEIQSIVPGALPYEIFEQTLNILTSS
jgi:protein-disulfide isomerase